VQLYQSDLVSDVVSAFKEIHGELPFTLLFVKEVANASNRSFNGVCDFSRSPPAIAIRQGLTDSELVEVLCHEFAHLACGLSAAHNEVWEACRENLHLRVASKQFPGR
jgi:hypothetical protein